MKVSAAMKVVCSDEGVGRALASVLGPDNRAVPRGMAFSMRRSGGTIRFRIESDSPKSALSTSVALLLDIALFEQVWLLSAAADGSHRSEASA